MKLDWSKKVSSMWLRTSALKSGAVCGHCFRGLAAAGGVKSLRDCVEARLAMIDAVLNKYVDENSSVADVTVLMRM